MQARHLAAPGTKVIFEQTYAQGHMHQMPMYNQMPLTVGHHM